MTNENIYTELQEILKKERGNGLTNQQIADKYGVSQSQANRLLNDPSSVIGSLSFAAVLRMFPRVRRLLDGDTASISIANSPSAAAAINGVAEAGASMGNHQEPMTSASRRKSALRKTQSKSAPRRSRLQAGRT